MDAETYTLRRNSRWTRDPVVDDGRAVVAYPTERDIEIFKLLARYRYLPSDYIHAFIGGNAKALTTAPQSPLAQAQSLPRAAAPAARERERQSPAAHLRARRARDPRAARARSRAPAEELPPQLRARAHGRRDHGLDRARHAGARPRPAHTVAGDPLERAYAPLDPRVPFSRLDTGHVFDARRAAHRKPDRRCAAVRP